MTRVIYLHGFASSSASGKARYFGERFGAHGVDFRAPDLNLPDFSTLTVTRMLAQVGSIIASRDESAAVIGSSLGGFVAVQAALQHPTHVTHLVLLAPALDFGGNRMRELGGVGLETWKASNRLDVFHYGYGRVIPVHYDLYEDARRYDSFEATITQRVQVFQGRRDDAVDPATVERWCRARPNVELHLLDDDHQLLGSLDFIWGEMSRFLSIHQQIP